MGRREGRRKRVGIAALLALAALFSIPAPGAAASIKEEALGRFGSGYGPEPAASGKLQITEDIGVDPATGHVYAVNVGNNRIDEFTPWGRFVKAFGWDVAPAGVNEVQELRVRAAEGAFELRFEAATTPELPVGASGEEVQDALNALATIEGAGGSVSVEESPGAGDGSVPYVYVVAFHGALGESDVPQVEALAGTPPPEGGVPSTVLEARTRADGSTAAATGLEACTAESGCQKGSPGGGAGQVGSVLGAAFDEGGDLWVADYENNRLQKFDPSGRFELMVGGDVNKTKVEEGGASEVERNLCTAASGDECQAGTAGTGDAQFKEALALAAGSGGRIYVGDVGRVQVFDEEGHYLEDLPDPAGVFAGKAVRRLAADPAANRLYLDLIGTDNVFVLDASTGAKLGERAVHQPKSLAVDGEGNLFAVASAVPIRPEHIAELAADGTRLIPDAGEEEACIPLEEQGFGDCPLFARPEAGFGLRGAGEGPAGDLYLASSKNNTDSYIRFWGPPPLSFEGPPPAPPTIEGAYAAQVGDEDASLVAEIDPHFFAGTLGTTTYYLQWGTAACIEAGGFEAPCAAEKPAAPGATLKAGIVQGAVKSAPVVLGGLTPRTEYAYRFAAEGSGAPGTLVKGAEHRFRTHASPAEATHPGCANEAFRTGASAALPDCRAYEMVSPVDKEGGEVKVLQEGLTALPATLDQAAADGEGLVYGTYRAYGDAQSAPFTSQYLARREAGVGWRSEAISPPRTTQIVIPAAAFDTEYKFLSPDLCSGWLRTYDEPTLSPQAVPGYSNLYRRSLCPGAGGYEAVTTAAPSGVEGPGYFEELQGVSGDGSTALYAANGKLTTDAPAEEKLLYAFRAGEPGPRYLCILPGGAPSAEQCTAGGPVLPTYDNRLPRLNGALSQDGDRVYWSDASGHLYLRENPFGEGAECTGGAPCSVSVAAGAEEKAQFWGASADGGRAVFSAAKEGKEASLYEFDAASKARTKIAGRVAGVAGMSADASVVYFVSEEDLDGGGPAQEGDENLYRHRSGEAGSRLVAALAVEDVNPGAGKGPVAAARPWLRATRVTPDGSALAFMSFAPLTGYDNTDAVSGQADAEVYLYRAGAKGGEGSLVCVSCNPAGTRPHGENIGLESPFWAAASIPVAENNLHESQVLSEDGKRLFFDSSDPLVLADSNGVGDVYEWESTEAEGCSEADASYVPAAEGCVALISSGKSSVPSYFDEASPSGDDAFFATVSSLVPQDPGSQDLYDARVGGGLPSPAPPAPECEGESCQHPPPAPAYSTPSSQSFQGPGNYREEAKPRKCAKGKVRRKGRCVRKRHKRHRKGHHRKQRKHGKHRTARRRAGR